MEPNDSYISDFCTEQWWKPSRNSQIASWQRYRGQVGPYPSSCSLETGSRGGTHAAGNQSWEWTVSHIMSWFCSVITGASAGKTWSLGMTKIIWRFTRIWHLILDNSWDLLWSFGLVTITTTWVFTIWCLGHLAAWKLMSKSRYTKENQKEAVLPLKT